MKERPILFSGRMVRAILDGSKTQTRRVIQPFAPQGSWTYTPGVVDWCDLPDIERLAAATGMLQVHWHRTRCQFGTPGDRLWVRETWDWRPLGPPEEHRARLCYGCDGEQRDFLAPADWNPSLRRGWRPSIFMPRWASRITLEVTEVRVERVQEITRADALAEGVESACREELMVTHMTPVMAFRGRWDALNAKRPGCSWANNPWVWAITFRRIAEVAA